MKNLGFHYRNTEGSHENWIKDVPGRRYKVTVDCPKQPFSNKLLNWMVEQAGVSKAQFYAAL